MGIYLAAVNILNKIKFIGINITFRFFAIQLLTKSASVRGFYLFNYAELWKEYFSKLAKLYEEGRLMAVVDCGYHRPEGSFKGVNSIFDAVEVSNR